MVYRVLLSLASGTLLSRLALIYLLPVATMLVGAFWGAALGESGGGVSNGHAGYVNIYNKKKLLSHPVAADIYLSERK